MTDETYMIPVFFHNLKGYDAHIILQYITQEYAPNLINVIQTSSEKFISFQIDNLRFLDSLQFLTASLDVQVNILLADGRDKFFHSTRHYPNSDLVFSKGVYPYEFMDGPEKFLLTELPPIDAFYSSLNEASISTTEYERAQKVSQEFGVKNMREYHDLYLNLDVLLLAKFSKDMHCRLRSGSVSLLHPSRLHIWRMSEIHWTRIRLVYEQRDVSVYRKYD